MKKILSIALILIVAAGVVFAGGKQDSGGSSGAASAAPSGQLPRNETLYYNGIIWDKLGQMNPYFVGGTAAFGIDGAQGRQLVFETLFVYDQLTGTLKPQIGESYSWSGQTLTVKLNPNVKFWDGAALTSADVVNSFELQKKYITGFSGQWAYLDSVTTSDPTTVVIKAKADNFNPLQVEEAISKLYITEKAAMDKALGGSGEQTALGKLTNLDSTGQKMIFPGTGPYQLYFADETKCVLVRNENYWGQHKSRYGKLPAPKYIAHAIYKDNAAGDAAFRAGEVDVSQQFISSVWTMPNFGKGGVSTFIPQAPYYFPGVIPMIVFNTKDPRLADPVVRRAIAMALDYNTIGQNAMSGYTAPYVASLMLPVPAEQALIDPAAIKPYQWDQDVAKATAAANAALDAAGWKKGADGIRAKGGVKLSGIRAECPQGWSDWNASLEVVAQAGKQIGMDIQTYFPNATVWSNDMQNGGFEIIMNSYGAVGIASPWTRAFGGLSDVNVPPEGQPNPIGNYGRWHNDEANKIIDQIPTAKGDDLKKLWTRLNVIYLQEMPAAGLMYRPGMFHTVNEVVWTGFPKMNDGSGVPPMILCDGYGIKGLYNLKLK